MTKLEIKRQQPQNLIIIDEIRMVKADMLYQLHFRLSKDIFQNNLPFGGLHQIKHPLGVLIFNPPKHEKSKMVHAIENILSHIFKNKPQIE